MLIQCLIVCCRIGCTKHNLLCKQEKKGAQPAQIGTWQWPLAYSIDPCPHTTNTIDCISAYRRKLFVINVQQHYTTRRKIIEANDSVEIRRKWLMKQKQTKVYTLQCDDINNMQINGCRLIRWRQNCMLSICPNLLACVCDANEKWYCGAWCVPNVQFNHFGINTKQRRGPKWKWWQAEWWPCDHNSD